MFDGEDDENNSHKLFIGPFNYLRTAVHPEPI